MLEPVRPVVDGEDPLDHGEHRTRRGPIDPTLLQLAPALRRHLSICAGLAVATAVVVLAQAEIIGRELPRLIDGDLEAATPLAGVLVAIGLGRFVLRWATEVSAARAAAASRVEITDRVIDHALVLDERGAADATPARVTTLVTDGVDALDPWIREYVPALCIAAVLPLAAGARIFAADLTSAVILLVAIPLIPVFMILIGRLAEDRADRQWATLQRLAAHFHDVLVGLPTLRLFGQAGAQVQRVRAVAEQYRVAVMRTLRVAFLSAAAMELLAMLSVALVAVTIGYRLSVGDVTLQAALIVLLLAPECSLPIRRVGAGVPPPPRPVPMQPTSSASCSPPRRPRTDRSTCCRHRSRPLRRCAFPGQPWSIPTAVDGSDRSTSTSTPDRSSRSSVPAEPASRRCSTPSAAVSPCSVATSSWPAST